MSIEDNNSSNPKLNPKRTRTICFILAAVSLLSLAKGHLNPPVSSFGKFWVLLFWISPIVAGYVLIEESRNRPKSDTPHVPGVFRVLFVIFGIGFVAQKFSWVDWQIDSYFEWLFDLLGQYELPWLFLIGACFSLYLVFLAVRLR